MQWHSVTGITRPQVAPRLKLFVAEFTRKRKIACDTGKLVSFEVEFKLAQNFEFVPGILKRDRKKHEGETVTNFGCTTGCITRVIQRGCL